MRVTFKSWLFGKLPGFLQRKALLARARAEIDHTGEIELLELGKFVSRGDLAIDVGANTGVYTLALSQLTDRVIAVEANPKLASMIQNMRLPGVQVLGIALAAEEGVATLNILNDNFDEATLRTQHLSGKMRPVTVQAKPLDSLALGPVGFIKIDVEGFEEEVLAGAQGTLDSSSPALLIEIEERHNEGGVGRIASMLQSKGYAGFFFHGAQWKPLAAFDPAIHQDERKLAVEGPFVRRAIDYVNNFLFLQPSAAAKVSR